MLLRAAAARWKDASPASCTRPPTASITFGAKNTLTYGQLVAEAAMKLAPPKTVTLKDPKDVEADRHPACGGIDTPEKITGQAQFGIDVSVPRPAHRGRRCARRRSAPSWCRSTAPPR